MNEKMTSKDPDCAETRAAAELVRTRPGAGADDCGGGAADRDASRTHARGRRRAARRRPVPDADRRIRSAAAKCRLSIYIQAIEEIAKADASTAWCVAQTSVASTIVRLARSRAWPGRFSAADPRALLAMGPPGSGRQGGRRQGRLPDHRHLAVRERQPACELACGAHCPVYEPDGTQRLDAGGMPVERHAGLSQEQRSDERRLACHRAEGQRQRFLFGHRPVRSGAVAR